MAITVSARSKVLFSAETVLRSLNLTGSYLSAVTSGDLIVGDDVDLAATFVGVAESDYESATRALAVAIEGNFELSVVAKTAGDASQVILPGCPLYWSAQSRIDKGPGVFVGVALERLASGATGVIGVHLSPRYEPAAPSAGSEFHLWSFGPFVAANIALNDLILDGFVPGYAGTIQKVWYHPVVASTTDGDIDLQFTIGGVVTTGGLITITDEGATEGDVIAGTAVTGANAFVGTDEINIKCVEATTALTEGSGSVLARIATAHTHS